jgi:hypothetical protein
MMKTSAAKSVAMEETEKLEIADIFRSYGDDYRQSRSVSHEQSKVMHHIEICRTARLIGSSQLTMAKSSLPIGIEAKTTFSEP